MSGIEQDLASQMHADVSTPSLMLIANGLGWRLDPITASEGRAFGKWLDWIRLLG